MCNWNDGIRHDGFGNDESWNEHQYDEYHWYGIWDDGNWNDGYWHDWNDGNWHQWLDWNDGPNGIRHDEPNEQLQHDPPNYDSANDLPHTFNYALPTPNPPTLHPQPPMHDELPLQHLQIRPAAVTNDVHDRSRQDEDLQ